MESDWTYGVWNVEGGRLAVTSGRRIVVLGLNSENTLLHVELPYFDEITVYCVTGGKVYKIASRDCITTISNGCPPWYIIVSFLTLSSLSPHYIRPMMRHRVQNTCFTHIFIIQRVPHPIGAPRPLDLLLPFRLIRLILRLHHPRLCGLLDSLPPLQHRARGILLIQPSIVHCPQ